MKKISVILAVLAILFLAGCASSGGGGGGAAPSEPYKVDLSTVKVGTWTRATKKFTEPVAGFKNTIPFGTQYDGAVFVLDVPETVASYSRISLKVNCFDADGNPIAAADGNAMAVVVYDVNGDLEGPEMGAGPNTPLKEFNVGGFSSSISTDRGMRITLNQKPGGILIQCAKEAVKFIEIAELTFL